MKALAFVLVCAAACGPGNRSSNSNSGGGDDTSGDDTMGHPDGNPSTGSDGGGVTQSCDKMDLVFVVDDSGSMSEEQANLATNFPMFATLLSNYVNADGSPIDFRIALTTTGRTITYTIDLGGGLTIPMTETGDNGAFVDNCNVSQRWLDPTTPNLGSALGCRAMVGTSGPSIEMPLLMSKWSLSERVSDGTNAGFLRDDALLGLVMMTDEDDQSTDADNFTITITNPDPPTTWNPSDEISFLDTLKGDRSRWAAAVIAGMGSNGCTSNFGDATDSPRLQDFVTQAGQQAVFSSICAGDLTQGLQDALNQFQAACGRIVIGRTAP
ncbi:MAG TPA: hypothetical protein VGM88_18755 [Kofleriaceae bacterium]|jgi:hypothetical protein